MLSRSAQRVQDALDPWGLSLEVVELPESTRSAKEAADAIGCEVGQIAKSLILRTKEVDVPKLVIASGVNRVDLKRITEVCGEEVELGKPEFVREITGFVIGGVPPVGHSQPIETFIDIDLMQFREIWAAAGTPKAVFRLSPDQLKQLTNGEVLHLAEG